jgi:hypothetical protein
MIRLTKKGIIATKYGDNDEEIDVEVSNRHGMFMALSDTVEFDDNVTLRDLFRIFEPIKDFISAYSTISYEAYANELGKPIDWTKREGCPIDCIEIYHGGSIFEQFKDISIGADAHGVDSSVPIERHGQWDEKKDEHISRYWAIDAQPMNNIADLPIKLNEKFDIEKTDDGSIFLSGYSKKFTLLEAIHAVFYEISFFGLPEDRDAFLDTLRERVEEIKNMTPEEKEAKLIPWEEVKKRLEAEEDGNGNV